MVDMTRQEMQQMLDIMRDRLIERLLTPQEARTLIEQQRNKLYNHMDRMHKSNQQVIRTSITASDQALRRMAVMEARMIALENQLTSMHQYLQQQLVQQQQLAARTAAAQSTRAQTVPTAPASNTAAYPPAPAQPPQMPQVQASRMPSVSVQRQNIHPS